MIGKICWSVFPVYDLKLGKNSFKQRPVLIISGPRNNDYTVLPVSTVKIKDNIDEEYDIEIVPSEYPKLGLKEKSYIRVHKQTVVHRASITSSIGDLKSDYADLYLRVLEKLEEYDKNKIDNGLS